MNPERAALLGVVAGGLITLVGSFFTSVLNIWLQWLQGRWQLKNEVKKDLLQKETVALQNCVQMIDFLIATKNTDLGKGGQDMWLKIRKENVCNGAFFPPHISTEFAEVIGKVLLLDSLDNSSENLDFEKLKRLRKDCVDHIHKK